MSLYGIVNLSLICMRAEPSHRAELVNQMLFGEPYEVLEQKGDWLRVNTCFYPYEGWIDANLYKPFSEKSYQEYMNSPREVVSFGHDWMTHCLPDAPFMIFLGSQFPKSKEPIFRLGGVTYQLTYPPLQRMTGAPYQRLLKSASILVRAPYMWGGKTIAGIDCSGLTQVCFQTIGITLPRDASQQALIGDSIDFIGEAREGDLVFFDNEDGKITHVGIIYGPGKVLHASGSVRIDQIDQHGIHSYELKKYTHKLRLIKRIIPDKMK
jgi:hypothetical protein